MEDAAYFNCGHRPYYLPYRNPYYNYYDQFYFPSHARADSIGTAELKFIGGYLKYIKVFAYIQIFIGGILLITDVSRIILLWNFLEFQGTKLEMLAQVSFPLFSLTLGFVTLASSLAPSQAFFKILAVVLISSSIPNFIFPKQSVFLTAALEAIEVSRAADKSAWKGSAEDSAGMIRSEAHNRLARLLATSISPGRVGSLGIQDLTSLPTDLLMMMQYLLSTYSFFSFLQILIFALLLFTIIRLLSN